MESCVLTAAAPTRGDTARDINLPQGNHPPTIDFLSNLKTCRFLSILSSIQHDAITFEKAEANIEQLPGKSSAFWAWASRRTQRIDDFQSRGANGRQKSANDSHHHGKGHA